jgi:ACS family hexuronate transporter-like MFS transporter
MSKLEQIVVEDSRASGTAAKGGSAFRSVRWAIALFFLIGIVLNYVSRNSLGIVASELQRELHISTQQYSWVVAAFQIAYTVFQPVCGWFLDVVGLKVGFALLAFVWSLACVLHPAVSNWMQLAVLRFCMGTVEAGAGPAQIKLVTEWFPRKGRSVALGWAGTGFSIGAMVAPPLVAGISLYWGWRAAFVVPGVIGIIWALIWWRFYAPPATSGIVSKTEREYILADQDAVDTIKRRSLRQAFVGLIRDRKFYGIALPAFLSEPAWQTMIFWLPLYLINDRGMHLKEIAMFAWLPFLMADIGHVCAGYLAPFFRKRFDLSTTNAAIATSLCGAVLMLSLAAVGLVQSPYVAILLIYFGGMGHQLISVMLGLLVMEEYKPDEVATVNGFRGSVAWIGGTLFSLLIGALASTTGFSPLFVCLGFFDLIGVAFMIALLGKRHERRAS